MSATPGPEPTQEEIEEYLTALREAPVHDLLLQAFSVLGTGAEVKLGMPDARVLIDGMEALVKATGHALESSEAQLSQAVAQLKLAQVQAEKQAGRQGGAGGAEAQRMPGEQPEPQAPGGQPAASQAPPTAADPQTGAGGGTGGKATDKLWIPGRDG